MTQNPALIAAQLLGKVLLNYAPYLTAGAVILYRYHRRHPAQYDD